MEVPSWPSVAFYSAFGIFVYYQRLYAQEFAGDGLYKLLLLGSAFLGMLTGFVYLVYYGWTVAWWAPVIPLGMSVIATIPATLVERIVGRPALSQIALIAWPVCAYLMFYTLPG
jgi:hypothetical protein